MRVAVDGQLAVGTSTGIGEYVRGLIDALRARGMDIVELSEPKLDPWRFDRRVFWDQVLLPQRARAARADVLHCASGTMPLAAAMPMVATVHDVAWLRVQAHARPYARYYFGKFSVERYRHAAAIAVDSEFSRRELLELVPDIDPARVRVVYPGVASDFCSMPERRGDGRTILVVGTVERRKNMELLIRTLPYLSDARIVSVGPFTPYKDECQLAAQTHGVADRVTFRGYVSRAELLDLYATCAVVAMPSMYEGFGYAVAQALCAGVPAIASDRSSLPEVAGDAARVVDVNDSDGWINALSAALRGEDDHRAAERRAESIARFAWSKSAADMAATYDLVALSPEWETGSAALR